jgi:MFS transporter, DHA2 family, multidrug resistance protein
MASVAEDRINPWLVALSVILPTFMEVMDTSIASVTLPHIAGSLSASTDEATWVLTSYLAANAVILTASSWFALRFGRKRFLLACIVLFTIASFACGSAFSLGMIVIARAIQGAAGGALQPLSQAILLESFPPEKRAQSMAVFGLGVVVAPIVGPTMGGWITDQYTWRWAFYINIPVGVLAVMLISRFVIDPPYIRQARVGRLDKIGLGLLALGLGTLQIVLDKGQEDDWFGALWIRWATAVVIVCIAAFLIREFLLKHPLVDLRVFGDRNFACGCLLIALFGGAIYGLITLLPLFYQTLLGYTAGLAGIAVAPRGVGAIFIMPIVGVLSGRIDDRWLIAAGFAIFGMTGIFFGHVTLGISEWSLVWPIIFSGAAAGLVFVPLTTATMGTLSNEQIGNATSLFNLLRNIGGSIGISVVNTVVTRHEQIRHNELIQHLTPATPLYRQLLAQVQRLAIQRRGAGVAVERGYAMVSRLVEQQATTLSYVDVFRDLALISFLCVPLVLLMKKVRGRRGAVAAH